MLLKGDLQLDESLITRTRRGACYPLSVMLKGDLQLDESLITVVESDSVLKNRENDY